MKTCNILSLILVTILAISCKDFSNDDCIDSICPCDDTIYYTHVVEVDTFILLDAEYAYYPDEPVDFHYPVPIDSSKYGNFRIDCSCAYYRHLLSEEDSISFLYLGGVRGFVYYPPPAIPLPDPDYVPCDPSNSVYIARDTSYRYITHPKPYAILKIFKGSESYIDTAYYPVEFSNFHEDTGGWMWAENQRNNYTEAITDIFVDNGFATDDRKFKNYLKNYYNIGNTGYYFIDVNPSSFITDDIYQTSFVLFRY